MTIPAHKTNKSKVNPSTELVAFRPFTQIFRYTLSVQHTKPTSLTRRRHGRQDPDRIATDDRSMPTDLPWLSPEKDPRRIGSPLGRTTHASQERTDIQNRAEVLCWTGSIRVGSASCGKSSARAGGGPCGYCRRSCWDRYWPDCLSSRCDDRQERRIDRDFCEGSFFM